MDEDATAEDNKRENNLASGCYKTLKCLWKMKRMMVVMVDIILMMKTSR